MVTARRTYLEMTDPGDLRPARAPDLPVDVSQASPCPSALYRSLYLGVGAAHRWTDRAAWSDADIARHLEAPGLEVWVARVYGTAAGFFELEPCPDGSVQIAYFGLLPAFIGRGLGGHLVTEAIRRAWALGPSRVWLHTCTFDHPGALPNYLKRGLTITRVEDYEVN